MSNITVSSHHAMSTWWQVRVAGEDEAYSAQAAHAAFAITDHLEALMSRFREQSEISILGSLAKGERYKPSGPVFDCLVLAEKCQKATRGAFDVCASARAQGEDPRWFLDHNTREFVSDCGGCRIDLGAIAKGYTLDQMAQELGIWGCEKFLLMSSGSSILAGSAPEGEEGWRVRLGDHPDAVEVTLAHRGLGTSGNALRGDHILDPFTGRTANRYQRSWAFADSAAEADALSTAWMNMDWDEITRFCEDHSKAGAAILDREGKTRFTGGTVLMKSAFP
jgi:thiamine biosynthesis lipoprotein